jgi:hypothetical protein
MPSLEGFPKVKPLTAINYQTWKHEVQFVLMEKGLWGIVSGAEAKPTVSSTIPSTATPAAESTTAPAAAAPTTTTSDIIEWNKKAEQAIGILGRLISQSLKHHLTPHIDNPASAWLHLKNIFGKNTAANIGRLRKEYTTIKFDDTKSMAEHLEYMEQLAHEIGVTDRTLTDPERAVAMLQSMPASYSITVQGIEAADRGTDPVYVYTKLVSEEQRRNSEKPRSSANDKSEAALKASHRVNKHEKRKCFKCNRPGHIARDCRSTNNNVNNESQPNSNKSGS